MKITIFGNGGSGKSTLARHLAAKHSLAYLELDMIAWQGIRPPTRFPLADSIREIDDFMCRHDQWVMDGNYGDMIEYLFAHTDEIIFLNPGVDACITNAMARPWEPHKFKSPEEQDSLLPTLIDWLKQYDARDDEYGLPRHKKLFDSFNGKKTELNNPAEYAFG